MIFIDILLIGWWIVIVPLSLVLFVRLRWSIRQSPVIIRDPEFGQRAHLLALIVKAILFLSFFAMLWGADKSLLWHVNFWFILLIGGVAMIFSAPYMRTQLPPGSWVERAFRVVWFCTGCGVIALTWNFLIKDFVRPWEIIEGRYESQYKGHGSKFQPYYYLCIEGHCRMTTGEVYNFTSTLRRGDRLRAEKGTGSGMIFRVERIDPPASPPPAINRRAN